MRLDCWAWLAASLLAASSARAETIRYGRHVPYGEAAVEYLYGPEGTWKSSEGLEYRWNYYPQHAEPGHPFDLQALIRYADGSRAVTARDANGILLLPGGMAFHEHAGKGLDGASVATPFTLFWFDDNWLARYMAQAYGRPEPSGLRDPGDFVRWSVLGGGIERWRPYWGRAPDQLALNGLYAAARGDLWTARSTWRQLAAASGAIWDGSDRRFAYTAKWENYHFALFKILTDVLLERTPEERRGELLVHWVSIHSALTRRQESDGERRLGWRSSGEPQALINTESTALGALALGVGGLHVFEAGQAPLHGTGRAGGMAGHISFGPYWSYPPGRYRVEFFLRATGAGEEPVATLDVFDASAEDILASRVLTGDDFAHGDHGWLLAGLEVDVARPANRLEFRVYAHGGSDLELACVRVR